MNKPNKNKHRYTENSLVVSRGEGIGGTKMGKGGQLNGDKWKLNFGW